MQQSRRNAQCSCGSGKKHKFCCGQVHRPIRLTTNPDYKTTLRFVPKHISWNKVELSETTSASIDEWNEFLLNNVGAEAETASQSIEFLLSHDPESFIADNRLGGMFPYPSPSKFESCWYWNTIDQQILELRVQLLKLFSTGLRSLFSSRFERIRSASRARLLFELGLRAISLLLVTKLSYGAVVTQAREKYISFNQSLSRFLWGSLYLTDSDRKLLSRSVGMEFTKGVDWLDVDYAPTIHQQQDLARFYAKYAEAKGDFSLGPEIETTAKYYKVLCKLIHPSGWMFQGRDQLFGVTDDLIDESIRTICIKTVAITVRWIRMLDNLHWDVGSFMETTERRLANGAIFPERTSVSLIDAIVEKYKDIRIGDHAIHQVNPVTSEGREVALQYQSLKEGQKEQVKKMIESFAEDKLGKAKP